MRTVLLLLFTAGLSLGLTAQELNARVTVVTTRVANNVNRNAFKTLETALNNFMNNRKWTSDAYAVAERIECQLLLNMESTDELNVYTGSLTIQSGRPIYNTSYMSPIINFKDDNVAFRYQEFQLLEFNENRVTGNDPLVSNLTALFAYYAYMIIGFDNLSFSPRGGDPYFLKAQNIVNNAPDGRNISGWKAFDGIRNRYWLAENILNNRYTAMHDAYYNYYRQCLDKFYEKPDAARAEMLNVLNIISDFNQQNPNTMINQFFFQGKASELIKIFSKAAPQDKSAAREMLIKLDITNAGRYQEELK